MASELKQQQQKVVRFSLYARRKQGMSEEKFHRHWSEVHGPLVVEWLARYGTVRYTQFHTSSSAHAQAQKGWSALEQMEQLPYDGVADFVVTGFQKLDDMRQDQFYKDRVQPDEEQVFESTAMVWNAGWEETFISEGKILEREK